ncbi:galactose-1-phosphate uridylyltransferase [Candidatus Levyibacteriota bacterium]|nr:galactose-1-phosphate uridylyltransferase [Candidatus Levybacteria bacterium]
MADFRFLHNSDARQWVISAPRRANRPNSDSVKSISSKMDANCPFCVKNLHEDPLYINGEVRILSNKFPFATIHEVVIHSESHYKSFESLPIDLVKDIFIAFRQRYITHEKKGRVYIFHNREKDGGESILHPHSQIVILPYDVSINTPTLQKSDLIASQIAFENSNFVLFCPQKSQWPDEVWITPKRSHNSFGEVNDIEMKDFASIVSRLFQIYLIRYEGVFPCNFYIYPGDNWYFRLIPRKKIMGGLEVGTGIFVNTQDTKETVNFIKTHLDNPNEWLIRISHQAEYNPHS